MTPPRFLVLTAWSEQHSLAVHQLLDDVLGELGTLPPAEGTTPLISFLELAAEELLTNIFFHGYGGKSGQARLECCATTEQGRQGVLLRITDGGTPFDPFTEAPTPDIDMDCQNRTVGGLGVFLVKSLATRHHYERHETSNVVELFFPLPEQEHREAREATKSAAQSGGSSKRRPIDGQGDSVNNDAGLAKGVILGSALILLLFLVFMPCPVLAEGVILHYEVVEEERPAEAMRPVQSLRPHQSAQPAQAPLTPPSLPTYPNAINKEGPPAPSSAPPFAQANAAPQAKALTPVPTEYLLDGMDVNALSPHAALLALPRMVPPPLALALREGRITAPAQWEALIAEAAHTHGLPPALIAAVIKTESDFRPDTVSHKGAQGLMQLMPATQHYLGVTDPFDPRANVLAGCAYLRLQWERFGNLELALAAYNAGPQNVIKYNGIPPFAETQNFVRRVQSHMDAY